MGILSKSLAKALMKSWPAYTDKNDYRHGNIFNLVEYTHASPEEQNRIKLKSAQFRYNYEKEICFFEQYFPDMPLEELSGKKVFDLGCFTGGRLAYWAEQFGFAEACGLDVNPIYAEAGKLFAESKGLSIDFVTGVGENLPYESNYFDYITSFDVFEHVQDIEKVMEESFRVLKAGGKLLTVFPPFFQPLESHLTLVTNFPGLHCLFSGRTLARAYSEIVKERGKEAYWYDTVKPELKTWEKSPSLNGITVAKFRRIMKKNNGWKLLYWRKKPILSDGKRANKPVFRVLRNLFALPARLPLLEEIFLSRIACILEKKAHS